MSWAAFAFGSGGERIVLSEPVFRPARSGSTATVRLMPSRPPTRTSLNPIPSSIGVRSAEMMISSE